MVAGPAHIHESLLTAIAPFVEKNCWVGTIFGQGPFAWAAYSIFKNRIQKDNITIWSLYNVPAICKIRKYGEAVNVIGPKKVLQCAVKPLTMADEVCCIMDDMFQIPTVPMDNFLMITLTPSNQIIHPARVYGVFKDWDGKAPLDKSKIPLLYEDMDDFSADEMQKLDDEIQAIKKAILAKYPHIDLSAVMPIKQRIIKQYGEQVKDRSTLTQVFRTNQGYRTAAFPLVPVDGGVHLNIKTRFFDEDIPYGLCILKDIAGLVNVQTPAIDKMIEWHQKFMNKQYIINGKLNKKLLKETGCPSRFGIKSIEQLIAATASATKPKL
mmetsp:Transcript_8691/g.7644  ORF Transcript_8691/g.7644 Transcript_8691/m.7644 type:complete len:324 (-) Transcript_8691:160-1131(-)